MNIDLHWKRTRVKESEVRESRENSRSMKQTTGLHWLTARTSDQSTVGLWSMRERLGCGVLSGGG